MRNNSSVRPAKIGKRVDKPPCASCIAPRLLDQRSNFRIFVCYYFQSSQRSRCGIIRMVASMLNLSLVLAESEFCLLGGFEERKVSEVTSSSLGDGREAFLVVNKPHANLPANQGRVPLSCQRCCLMTDRDISILES